MLHDALGFVAADSQQVVLQWGRSCLTSCTHGIVPTSQLMTTPTAVQAPLEVMLASSNTAEGHAERGHHGTDVEAQRQQAAGPLAAGTDGDAAGKSPLLEEEAAIAVADASCLAPGPVTLQAAGSGTDNRPWWEGDNPGALLSWLVSLASLALQMGTARTRAPLQSDPCQWTCV